MNRWLRRVSGTVLPSLALLLLAALPGGASASPLLDQELALALGAPPARPAPPDLSLDFDLLGTPPPPQVTIDDEAMKTRRSMLDLHQKFGLGLLSLQLATTVVGQLNYNDKYGSSPPVTGRYEATHAVLAYSTLGVFAVTGALAVLAPRSPARRDQYDRLTVHKAGMAVATAGMIAQGVVGIYADQQEGRLDQAQIARTHLIIGYVTLAAVGVAVGALVF